MSDSFFIIGSDGREYGPVRVEEVRAWIGQGRCHAITRARRASESDWKTIGDFPEFAAMFLAAGRLGFETGPSGSTIPPPPVPPRTGARLGVMDCMSRASDLYIKHFGLLLGTGLVLQLILGAVPALLIGPLHGGMAWMFLKLHRGEPILFGDAFEGFERDPIGLILGGVLKYFFILAGYALGILPGIFLQGLLIFSFLLVIDRRMDWWDSMKFSGRMALDQPGSVAMLLLVILMLSIAGFLACCIGFFVAWPLCFGVIAVLYDQLLPRDTDPVTRAP